MKTKRGFTLIEVLVVITIISIMTTLGLLAFETARKKARDVKRKSDLSQIGRLITNSCYVPSSGAGDYDLMDLITELKTIYPDKVAYLSYVPRDLKSGTDTETFYRYSVSDQRKCAVYANLENGSEPVTLPAINSPTPGGGTGVLRSASEGWNGSDRYFQVSN